MANGTIRQKNNRWEYRVYIDGKQKSFTGETKKDALDKYARFIKDRHGNTHGKNPHLSKWMETWLEDIKYPSVSFATYKNYKLYAEKYVSKFLPDKPLNEYVSLDIDRFLSLSRIKHLSTSAQRHIYLTLKGLFDSAVENGYIGRSPVSPRKYHTDKLDPAYFTPEQIRAIFERTKPTRGDISRQCSYIRECACLSYARCNGKI